LPNLLIFYTCKCILGGGYAAQLCSHVPQDGRWDTGVGMSVFIYPNSRIHIESPVANKADWKKSAKSEFDEFTSVEK